MNHNPISNDPEAERRCYVELLRVAVGKYPNEAVIGAAFGLIIDAISNRAPQHKEAEVMLEMYFGKSIMELAEKYDAATGKRRNATPPAQVLSAPHVKADDYLRG